MKTFKAMIAEDEQFALEELTYMLEQEEDIELCPSAVNGQQVLELYFKHKPDVLFLDIEIPIITGVEVAKEILRSTDEPPLFVFTTAYDEYAIEAFEVEAIDYLLKPFDIARLQQALKRIRKHIYKKDEAKVNNDKLLITNSEKMIVVSPDEIVYAVTNQDHQNPYDAYDGRKQHDDKRAGKRVEKLSLHPYASELSRQSKLRRGNRALVQRRVQHHIERNEKYGHSTEQKCPQKIFRHVSKRIKPLSKAIVLFSHKNKHGKTLSYSRCERFHIWLFFMLFLRHFKYEK